MARHDFRYTLLVPQHTLIECRSLKPGHYQVTGNGGHIQNGDTLVVSLKGSRDLSMELQVRSVRHLLSPPGQWTATASGPAFQELAIHDWQVQCDGCNSVLSLEFAVDASLGKEAQVPAAEKRLQELGWINRHGRHLCRQCQQQEA